MWKLNEIYAENICSFKEIHYVLHQHVTTLIFGNNKDNETQHSNGSGKSALIECIALGITGTPLRKVKNDEIINDKTDECRICLQFFNDSQDEVFTIERQFFRKGPSIVNCHIERNGKGVTTDEAVQPSIDSYNKYILEKLGISKEELFNNFILSKYKYKDFLNSSDTEKKEIINRFSNASLVDKALEQIESDKQPISEMYRNAELDVTGLDARIETLTEQIGKEEQSRDEKSQNKKDKIEAIEKNISEKRSSIRSKHEEINALSIEINKLEGIDEKVQDIEKLDLPIEEFLRRIKELLPAALADKGTDWNELIAVRKQQTYKLERELEKWNQALTVSDGRLRELLIMQAALKEEYRIFSENYTIDIEGYDTQLGSLEQQIALVSQQKEQLLTEKRNLSSSIEDIKNKLAGTIICPACQFRFLASDKNFDVVKAQKELGEKASKWDKLTYLLTDCDKQTRDIEQAEIQIKDNRRSLIIKNNGWIDKMNVTKQNVSNASFSLEEQERSRKKTQNAIGSIQSDIDVLKRKIFDEVFGIIDDACQENERRINLLKEDIAATEMAIDTLEKTIADINNNSDQELLNSLKNSLKEYRKKSVVAIREKEKFGKSLQELNCQEQVFVQFKSYLANTKIAALGKVTNDFLQAIGSDIRILLSGYTPLKSGKIREKISVSLIRNNINYGSFGKFSAGEAARVNLATILAMRQLINTNCEGNKGLDLLVLDEILEATDESGLASIFAALNQMGLTALIVSHGNIAEGYQHKLIINKQNGESYIDAKSKQ
jgi:exonuclease SbcC|nr:MAG TPA: STRUCTURAL MAINTENANCE OF CHROMOSOMES PROTEIN [Caudoviricetes sp.]